MATRIGNAQGALTATTATSDVIISGESRTPTGAVVYVARNEDLSVNANHGSISCGYYDGTNQHSQWAGWENGVGDTDATAISRENVVLSVNSPGTATLQRSATCTFITGGIRLTPIQSGTAYRLIVILVFEAECFMYNTGNGTRTEDVEFDIAHTLAGEPNFGWLSHVNRDFEAGGSNARMTLGMFSNESDTIIQKYAAHTAQNAQIDGESHARISTTRGIGLIFGSSGGESIGGLISGIDGTNFSMTPDTNPLQNPVLGLLVYASDVTAEVLSVDAPTSDSSDWNFNNGSFTSQHLTLYTSMMTAENTAFSDSASAGAYGIYITDGTDEFSICMSDENAADPTVCRSRTSDDLHLLDSDATDAFEMDTFVFTSDGWDVASGDITSADTTVRKWLGLLLQETSPVIITDVNTTEAWDDGDTGLVITGTGFV